MALLLRKFLRPVAISGAVAFLTAFAALTVSYLLFPVTGVEVKGARMFPESEAWQAFPEHASLLLLNLDALERRIESNPWVKGAKVLKDWESGIVTVEVEERRPVLDGDLGGRRIVLSADGTKLPSLGGAGLERVEIDEVQLEEILRVARVLEDNGVTLDSVDGVGAKGVDATVEGRSVLFAGNVGVGQVLALEGLIEQHTDTPYFDLRTPERVVIGAESGKESGVETGE
ncbi:MAG: FtsQ-type POTRA domain-containing protein [Actinomycetota bacterium]|nr:FtsQ-type POTRA domain-containing protein [Actinomycetota bacterium]